MIEAPVLSTHTNNHGIRTLVVACPWCRKRHRHHWPPWEEDPGVRMSHCAGKQRPYRPGLLPPAYLVRVVTELRRAGNYLARTPWTESVTPGDADEIGEAAQRFVDLVEQAKRRIG